MTPHTPQLPNSSSSMPGGSPPPSPKSNEYTMLPRTSIPIMMASARIYYLSFSEIKIFILHPQFPAQALPEAARDPAVRPQTGTGCGSHGSEGSYPNIAAVQAG